MPQNNKKLKASPTIISPDGVEIQITAGRKMKFVRHVMRSDFTVYECKILTVLIDLTNEGYGEDKTLFGLAYPSLVRLEAEVGMSHASFLKALKGLKGSKTIQMIGANDQGKSSGGRNKLNNYWLPGWNEFGAVDAADKNRSSDDLFGKRNRSSGNEETGRPVNETGHEATVNRSLRDPDSSSLPTFVPNSEETQNEERAAGALTGNGTIEETAHNSLPANDNLVAPWPDDAWQQFWKLYPKKVGEKKAMTVFWRMRRDLKVEFSTVMIGLKAYVKSAPNPKFLLNPATFLSEERWSDEYATKADEVAARLKANRKWAI